MNKIFLVTTLIWYNQLKAQDSTSGSLSFSGYVEAYYQYDFNQPTDNNRPAYVYNHNRHNEFNLNLGFLKGSYNTDRIRANLAIAAGTYMNANYASEPGVFKNIFEANAGYRVTKKKNLWLEAGIFASHIGFESAISKDCWTLTRSILADNSPYYEAGGKLTYTTDNKKWLLSAMALNGWQRIKRIDGNSMMSWGSQVQFRPSDKVLLNYSGFIGTDKPDSTRLLRIFHNFYGIFNLSEKLGLTMGFDIGTEEKSPTDGSMNTWYSPVAIIKYTINNRFVIAVRAEHYNDKHGVIIATGTPNGFQTTAYSLNFDYAPAKNILIRLEGRKFRSKDEIFLKQEQSSKHNLIIIGSIAISF